MVQYEMSLPVPIKLCRASTVMRLKCYEDSRKRTPEKVAGSESSQLQIHGISMRKFVLL